MEYEAPMPPDWAILSRDDEDPDNESDPSYYDDFLNWKKSSEESPDIKDMDHSQETQLIKTVASAYFCHLPLEDGLSYWVNLALVSSVFETKNEDRLTVKFTNGSHLIFSGDQRVCFLAALGEVSR